MSPREHKNRELKKEYGKEAQNEILNTNISLIMINI